MFMFGDRKLSRKLSFLDLPEEEKERVGRVLSDNTRLEGELEKRQQEIQALKETVGSISGEFEALKNASSNLGGDPQELWEHNFRQDCAAMFRAPASYYEGSLLDKSLTAAEELALLHEEMPTYLASLYAYNKARSTNENTEDDWPFLFDSGSQGIFKVSEEVAGDMGRWFFIGDIHGDFYALHTLLNYVASQRSDWRIVMLGDIMDRGIHSLECFIYLLKWAAIHPERIIWIAGNHDVCFSWKEQERSFESSVSPSEFKDFLNRKDSMKAFRQAWGRLFLEFSERLPRAVLFPNGLLATHGGIPHDDHQTVIEDLGNPNEQWKYLNSPECLQDFTWTRIHRNPKKRPNRCSKGTQFGFKNFERFCEVVADVYPVKHLVNGHEHPSKGFDPQEKYKKNKALTLRGFGFHPIYPGFSAYLHYNERLYIGQGATEGTPEIVEVPVDKEALAAVYPLDEQTFQEMVYRLFPEQIPPAPPPEEEGEEEEDEATADNVEDTAPTPSLADELPEETTESTRAENQN